MAGGFLVDEALVSLGFYSWLDSARPSEGPCWALDHLDLGGSYADPLRHHPWFKLSEM